MYMYLRTPYCDNYVIDMETGNITRWNYEEHPRFSGGWKFLALKHVKRNEYIWLKSIVNDPTILDRIDIKYKNGHPQWTVLDLDYGTRGLWRNTNVHGVSSISIKESK